MVLTRSIHGLCGLGWSPILLLLIPPYALRRRVRGVVGFLKGKRRKKGAKANPGGMVARFGIPFGFLSVGYTLRRGISDRM
jgi:hypothetical protein